MNDAFGDLRALLQGAPSSQRWVQLCTMLDAFEEHDYTARVAPYVSQHLNYWEDTLRVMPAPWVRTLLQGRHAQGMELCKRLVLKDIEVNASVIEALKRHRTSLEHITMLNLFGSRVEEHAVTQFYASPALRHVQHINLAVTVMQPGREGTSTDAHHRATLPKAWKLKSITGAFMSDQLANVFPPETLQDVQGLDLLYMGDFQGRRLWHRAHIPNLKYLRLGFTRRLMTNDSIRWLQEASFMDGVEVLELMTLDEHQALTQTLSAHPWPNLKAIHVLEDPRRTQHASYQLALEHLRHLRRDGQSLTLRMLSEQPNATWPEHLRRMGISSQW